MVVGQALGCLLCDECDRHVRGFNPSKIKRSFGKEKGKNLRLCIVTNESKYAISLLWRFMLSKILLCVAHGFKYYQDYERTPRVSFFFEKFKLLGLGRQIGPKNVGAFWVFLAELQSLSDGVRITQK